MTARHSRAPGGPAIRCPSRRRPHASLLCGPSVPGFRRLGSSPFPPVSHSQRKVGWTKAKRCPPIAGQTGRWAVGRAHSAALSLVRTSTPGLWRYNRTVPFVLRPPSPPSRSQPERQERQPRPLHHFLNEPLRVLHPQFPRYQLRKQRISNGGKRAGFGNS